MRLKTLTALPVYNEARHLAAAIAGALTYSSEVLVVNDGSTDGSSELLQSRDDIHLIEHPRNFGYGKALRSAFDFAVRGGYDLLTTIDCDGQHQPQLIPKFVETCRRENCDVVSGSRYLKRFAGDHEPPAERLRINKIITAYLKHRLNLAVTDAFCGFKTYRVSSLSKMRLTEDGYAMPLELWVRAVQLGLKVVELPVPLIYLDKTRSFGNTLDNAETRISLYFQVLERARLRQEHAGITSEPRPPFSISRNLNPAP